MEKFNHMIMMNKRISKFLKFVFWLVVVDLAMLFCFFTWREIVARKYYTNSQNIRNGMSKAQVSQIMGRSGKEIIQYYQIDSSYHHFWEYPKRLIDEFPLWIEFDPETWKVIKFEETMGNVSQSPNYTARRPILCTRSF